MSFLGPIPRRGVVHRLRQFLTHTTILTLAIGLAGTAGAPASHAADGRSLLVNAITNYRGSFLVYNFGGDHPAPLLNAAGNWYESGNGGHLLVIKAASQRMNPRLLVDSHRGIQSRCERDPRARTAEGLLQASEVFTPLEAWQALGRPTIAVNANFFDIRGQQGGSWTSTGCSSPLGAYVDNTRGQGRANAAVTGTIPYAGKQGLSGGNEVWTALSTMIIPSDGAPYMITPSSTSDFNAATGPINNLVIQGARFVAVSGIGLLAPGDTGQLNDGGPSAARTALGYVRSRDEMYIFQGGSHTPDQIQDLFRGLGSDTAILLDGGGSSAIVLRRDTGGRWAGSGTPRGSCDTPAVLCDSRERALPGWLGFA